METTSRARALRTQLFGSNTTFLVELNRAFDAIGFTADFIKRSRRSLKSVLIKDAVWGMMEFEPDEIALIDTPVFQRLRGIRQLGFSFLTYPAAEHSRFSHSLGVSHVVKRFLYQTEVNSKATLQQTVGGASTEINAVSCTLEERKVVRHAALLHDVGHFPFSHASERIFQNFGNHFLCGLSVDDFLVAFEEHLELEVPSLAECLSIAIVLSPRFAEYYKAVVETDQNIADIQLLRIALVIGGQPISGIFPGLSSIISHSNVDADKVDYLSRDSLFCGIPVGIDAARLFFRSMFLELDREQLIALSPEVFNRGRHREKHFIVNASGLDTIDEIVHARATMFQRVYRHKTTRLVERLFEKSLVDSTKRGSFGEPQVMKIWAMPEDLLLEKIISGETRGDRSFSGWRISERAFPKRALVLGVAMLRQLAGPPIQLFDSELRAKLQKDAAGEMLSKLRSKELFGPTLNEFETALAQAAHELRDLVKSSPGLNVPDAPCRLSVLALEQIDGQSKNHIILEGRQLNFHKKASRRVQQVAGDEIDRSVGFVFAEPEWREIAQLAARKFIASQSARSAPVIVSVKSSAAGLDIDKISVARQFLLDRDELARRTGVDPERLSEYEFAAAQKGYFDSDPRLFPYRGDPLSDDELRELQEFDGQSGWRVGREHCANFIEQFPPRLRSEARGLISQFRILGRTQIRNAFSDLLRIIQEREPGLPRYAIAGFTPNSGSLVRSLLEQELREYAVSLGWEFLKSPHNAVAVLNAGGVVVFVDDNISSGIQARAQFSAFSGISKSERSAELRSDENVYEDMILFADTTKSGKVFLAVVVAEPEGLRAVETDAVCKNAGVIPLSWKTVDEMGKPKASDEMESFLGRVGEALLATTKKDWTAENRRNNRYGYDNAGALLATKFNVPTGTITAFWMPGIVEGIPWMPLLLRRGYQKQLCI